MDDRLGLRADAFDYLHDPLPPELHWLFGDQTQRARQLLQQRTSAELDYAFDSLEWLLQEGHHHFYSDLLAGAYGPSAFLNRAKALRAFAPRFDLLDQPAFPQATWPEYFAALALACLGEQLHALAQPTALPADLAKRVATDPLPQLRAQAQQATALEAMEAICLAEQLQMESQLLEQIEATSTATLEVFRKTGQQGGKRRTAPFNALREKLLTHYDQHLTERSNREAAKRLYNLFTDEVDAVMSGDDPAHQIAKWIGNHLRRAQVQN